MKKFLVVLLALACLSTLVYAEGSTVGFGWGRVQFNAASGDSTSGSQIMTGWSGPGTGWPPAPRENLGLAYAGDFTSFQLTAYLDGTTLSWVNINGTLNLVPDMFKVMIGEFNGDGFDAFRKHSSHPIRDVGNGGADGRMSGWGIIADLAPKDSGLEAAVFIQTGDPTGASSIATLNSTIGNTEVGASYTLPGMLKVAAGSVIDNLYNAGGTGYARVIFGRVELLMVPNLSLFADVAYDGFDLATTVSNINAMLGAGYSMEALGIAFAAKFGSNDVLGTKTMTWEVYPEAWYDAGAITAGLYVGLAGSDVANSGIGYQFEPWVKLDDFNLRVSFHYTSSTASGAISTWEVPILITWGF